VKGTGGKEKRETWKGIKQGSSKRRGRAPKGSGKEWGKGEIGEEMRREERRGNERGSDKEYNKGSEKGNEKESGREGRWLG
jgi:hypothetical protein